MRLTGIAAAVCAALVMFAGCTEPTQFKFDDYHAGSRLKPRMFVGDDDSKGIIGWHDFKLGFDCDFVRAAGGIVCLKAGGWAMTNYYRDSTCTIPLSTATPPDIEVRVDAKRKGVYQPTSKLASTCFVYSSGDCAAIPDCAAGTASLFETEEVTDSFAYVAEITGQ